MIQLFTFSSLCLWVLSFYPLAAAQLPIDGAFIIKLSDEASVASDLQERSQDAHHLFRKRALELDLTYTVRHEFQSPGVYTGLSIHLPGIDSSADAKASLEAIPGVVSVTPVYPVFLIDSPGNDTSVEPAFSSMSYDYSAVTNSSSFPSGGPDANLASALQMGSVDKVHALGITGEGVKIGVIDSGVDYRHPALGGGFGPGFKIAGGYSYIFDNGTVGESSDPLATCYRGGHGTHVTGIIGMDSLASPAGLPISGVAPDASIFMYRVFSCQPKGLGIDYIIAAMLKAHEDGVDLVSMSLQLGAIPIDGTGNPLAEVITQLSNAGVGVVVAMSNHGRAGASTSELYTETFPSTAPEAIGVGAVANTDFPLVYGTLDSVGSELGYASIWPIAAGDFDVYIVDRGCGPGDWTSSVSAVSSSGGNINTTIFAFQVDDSCRPLDASRYFMREAVPYVLGYFANSTDPYNNPYLLLNQADLGTQQFIAMDSVDGTTLVTNFAAGGGYSSYKLTFQANSTYSSPSQPGSGGLMDYYSSFGPVRLKYDLKPQISAPGGNILSTYPLGVLGNYEIFSGTSMATPYIAGCYALIKSKFPTATPSQIKTLLQTNAKPMPWVYDTSILSSTAQQGAGLVDVYAAVTAQSEISPGQILASDNSRTVYGAANLTIINKSDKTKTYTFSHQGAGYMDKLMYDQERSQIANYGSAAFSEDTVQVAAGGTATVEVNIRPPASRVKPAALPVFGGFVQVQDADGDDFSIPYVGPPYSLYNTNSIGLSTAATHTLPGISYRFSSGSVRASNLIKVNNTIPWEFVMSFGLWTTAYRIDILPANTTLVPTHWGFDNSTQIEYQVSSSAGPSSTFLGHGSYGNLKNDSGLLSPASKHRPYGRGLTVKGDAGATVVLGAGDYRFLLSILRWGGEAGISQDWETWLGPVIRMVDGPVLSP